MAKKPRPMKAMQAAALKRLLAQQGVTHGRQTLTAKVVVGTKRVDNCTEVHWCSAIAFEGQPDVTQKSRPIGYDWDIRLTFDGFGPPPSIVGTAAVLATTVDVAVSWRGKTFAITPASTVVHYLAAADEDFTTPGSVEDFLRQRYGREFDGSAASAFDLVCRYGAAVAQAPDSRSEHAARAA